MTALRVVVADDQELVRSGLALILDAQPDIAVVGEAGDGDEALRAILELSPDVALLDVRMPGLDGLEIARRLRDLRGVAVVLLTGSDTHELEGAAESAGVADLLSKDMSRDAICRRLLAFR